MILLKFNEKSLEIKSSNIQLVILCSLAAFSFIGDSLNYLLFGLIGVALFLICVWLDSEGSKNRIFENHQYIILGLIVLVGLLLRLNDLGVHSLWVDEAMTSNAAISLLENGKPVFNSGFTYWRAFPHTVLTSISIKIFGTSDFAVRFPSVIIGTLTIFLTFLTGKKFFDRDVGIVAALIISLSTWEIVWSKQARMYSLLQFLYLLSVFLIYKAERKPSNRNILALLSAIVLSTLTHITAYLLPLIAISYFFYSNYIEGERKISWRLFSVPVSLIVLFQLLNNSFIEIIHRLSFNPGNIQTYLSWISTNSPALLLFGLAGIGTSIRKEKKTNLLMLGAALPVLYIYLLHYHNTASRYLYVVIPFFAIWSSLYIVKISRNLKTDKLKFKAILVVILLLFLFSGSFVSGDYRPGLHAPQPDFKSAYNYVRENRKEESIVISRWTSPAVYYLNKPPEYSLVGDYPPKTERSFNGLERYSGAKFIDNSDELRKVVEQHEHGWVVLDKRGWSGLDTETQRIISNMNEKKHLNEIKVWKWK